MGGIGLKLGWFLVFFMIFMILYSGLVKVLNKLCFFNVYLVFVAFVQTTLVGKEKTSSVVIATIQQSICSRSTVFDHFVKLNEWNPVCLHPLAMCSMFWKCTSCLRIAPIGPECFSQGHKLILVELHGIWCHRNVCRWHILWKLQSDWLGCWQLNFHVDIISAS